MKNQTFLRKLNILAFFSIFFFYACNSTNKEDKKETVNKTINLTDTLETKQTKTVNKENDLLGIWNIEDAPVFEIKQDSIYYIDNDMSYKYTLKDSVISIYYDDFIYKGIMSLENSKKLTLKDSVNTNYYYKE